MFILNQIFDFPGLFIYVSFSIVDLGENLILANNKKIQQINIEH